MKRRTWRGERGEEWSSAQGLESILISIQSLMSANPYENEPGFEDAKTDFDKKNQAAYVAKVRLPCELKDSD
jgi:ubiquitin-conjugating enzyme E2 Z